MIYTNGANVNTSVAPLLFQSGEHRATISDGHDRARREGTDRIIGEDET
jgi:hypothetical protein